MLDAAAAGAAVSPTVVRTDRSRRSPLVAIVCRSAARAGGVAVLLFATLGADCDRDAVQVRNRPPDPRLVDERGDVDADGFAALVAAVEAQRGLGFIQQPQLELLEEGDSRLPALRAEARALEPCPPATIAGAEAAPAGAGCFADASLEFVLCTAPPELGSARHVVARLLDAQNYPRLAAAARERRGDPGVALRALLAASASARTGPSHDVELLDLAKIEVERRDDAGAGCVDLAAAFLASQSDPEAPFRTPPLSTKMLASPKAYRAGERPQLLLGAPPAIADCEVASDESFGVARILLGLLAQGGSLPGAALAGWQGDRAVHFACASGDAPWIYAAELDDVASASQFAASVPRTLLGTARGGAEAQRIGRRVVVAHGVDAARARAWAASLVSRELVGFE